MMAFITSSGWTLWRGSLAIVARPSADFHVPYAAPMLPKTSASAAPRKPKNGAYVGQYGEIAIERDRPPEEHRPRCVMYGTRIIREPCVSIWLVAILIC